MTQPELPTIHALRAFAAVMVMGHHVTYVQGNFLSPLITDGGHGVDVFFVISGFVMVYTNHQRHGLRAAWQFLQRRFMRIYPPYWVVMFTVWGLGFGHVTSNPLAAFFLYDQAGPAILQQAWTLSLEIAFYLFFVAFFFVGMRGFAVLSVGWVALVLYNFLFPWYGGLLLFTRVAEFFIGVGCAYVVLAMKGTRMSGIWPLLFGALLLLVFYFTGSGIVLPHYWDVSNYAPVVAALVMTGALWDLHRKPQYPQWIMTVGDASYMLYLIQQPGDMAVPYVVQLYQLPPVMMEVEIILLMGCLVMIAVGLHWWIEQPLVARRSWRAGTR